jgi:hypothetical protein
MEQAPDTKGLITNPNVAPRGPGGLAGLSVRRVLTVLTAGFAFPNSFVEGMDLTATQKTSSGTLYANDKKTSASKSRF